MLSPAFYAKLNTSYHEALRQLETHLKEPESDHAQNALLDFMGKYMTPREFWCLSNKYKKYNKSRFPCAIDSLFHSFFYNDSCKMCKKYYDCNVYGKLGMHENFLFPQIQMAGRFKYYEIHTNSFIPRDVRQRYEEMKPLYLKIKKAEGDVDEWFAALLETNDDQFVKENVEHRLSQDLTDRKLWMKYIDYLWDNDFKHLLETYSKCVRFFTDDAEIMDGYRQAAYQYGGHIPVPWKNPCSIEVYDGKFWDKKAEEFHRSRIIPPVKPPLTIHFVAVNPAKPDFPFLSPTIRYILENASGEVLQKLFKTCKWFRVAKPVNVCYKFEENSSRRCASIDIEEQSIISSDSSFLRSNVGQIFISNVFLYPRFNEENSLSKILPKIYRCTAKYVRIEGQNLSWKELQFLIGDAVDLSLAVVQNSSGNDFKLEDILQATPKLKRFTLTPVECSTETSEKLCELQFENKLDYICLGYNNGIKLDSLDPDKFAEFVKKNFSSTAQICLRFDYENGKDEYINRFLQVLGDAVKEKWSGDEKPDVEISKNR